MSLDLVKSSDTGEYEVKASNTMGTVSTKTFVHVFSEYFLRNSRKLVYMLYMYIPAKSEI